MENQGQQQHELRLLEAILFAASEPLDMKTISDRFPEEKHPEIPALIDALKERFTGSGLSLVERDGRYALRTASDLAGSLDLQRETPRKMSRAAQETMAIIAYHQPVTRAEIENIRGVAISNGTIDVLIEAGWVKPGRRREVPGRPLTWVTTPLFLDHFGLESLEALPGLEELKSAGLLDKRPAIDNIATGDLFGDEENPKEEDDSVDLFADDADPEEDDEGQTAAESAQTDGEALEASSDDEDDESSTDDDNDDEEDAEDDESDEEDEDGDDDDYEDEDDEDDEDDESDGDDVSDEDEE